MTTSTQRANARLFAWANGLQNVADQLSSPKTVLAWMFAAAGVPAFFIGLLVPVRESGSLLPQAPLAAWVKSRTDHRRLWVWGSVGQALCIGAVAVAALTLRGSALGIVATVALCLLALCRALCSLTGKDMQGQIFAKGERGHVTGLATAVGGALTLVAGVVTWWFPQVPAWWLLSVAAGAWAVAGVFAARLRICVGDGVDVGADAGAGAGVGVHSSAGWWRSTWALVLSDAPFRRFITVRSLLLVTALSGSYIVLAAQQLGHSLLGGLAGFIIASGLSGLVGGRVAGLWADKSSRLTMAYGSAVASAVLMLTVGCAWMFPPRSGVVYARRVLCHQPGTHGNQGGAQDIHRGLCRGG